MQSYTLDSMRILKNLSPEDSILSSDLNIVIDGSHVHKLKNVEWNITTLTILIVWNYNWDEIKTINGWQMLKYRDAAVS